MSGFSSWSHDFSKHGLSLCNACGQPYCTENMPEQMCCRSPLHLHSMRNQTVRTRRTKVQGKVQKRISKCRLTSNPSEPCVFIKAANVPQKGHLGFNKSGNTARIVGFCLQEQWPLWHCSSAQCRHDPLNCENFIPSRECFSS